MKKIAALVLLIGGISCQKKSNTTNSSQNTNSITTVDYTGHYQNPSDGTDWFDLSVTISDKNGNKRYLLSSWKWDSFHTKDTVPESGNTGFTSGNGYWQGYSVSSTAYDSQFKLVNGKFHTYLYDANNTNVLVKDCLYDKQ